MEQEVSKSYRFKMIKCIHAGTSKSKYLNSSQALHCKKKVRDIPVPSRDVTNQFG